MPRRGRKREFAIPGLVHRSLITIYLTFDLHRCFLITFYFTQELLPSIGVSDSDNEDSFVQVDKAIKFVKAYGAYLTLHLSLVCAAMVKAHTVIDELLALAKYDPRHREVLKDLSKASSLVLYDSVCFSPHISFFNIAFACFFSLLPI
jgi:hypothetical protein